MTDVERVLKIASRFTAPFRTVEITRANRGREFSNTSMTVGIALRRGLIRELMIRGRVRPGPRRFALTAKGRKFVAGL